MSRRWRRLEVLLPLQFNDGREVPSEWLAEAVLDIVDRFGAASYETQHVEGHWRQGGVLYRDTLVRLVVDIPHTAANRTWMRDFKARWKARLEQLELLARQPPHQGRATPVHQLKTSPGIVNAQKNTTKTPQEYCPRPSNICPHAAHPHRREGDKRRN